MYLPPSDLHSELPHEQTEEEIHREFLLQAILNRAPPAMEQLLAATATDAEVF